MASIHDVYGAGETLKASDLPPGRQVRATIQSVKQCNFDDGNKLEITFLNKDKKLICNKTNAGRIAMEHGEDFESWPGKVIFLHQDVTEYQGKPMPCVRVVPHTLVAEQPEAATVAATQQAPQDEIPF